MRILYSVAALDGLASAAVAISEQATSVAVSCIPTTSAKIQYTLCSQAVIDAGTADWIDWSKGAVTSASADLLPLGATGVRCLSVTGAAKMQVVEVV